MIGRVAITVLAALQVVEALWTASDGTVYSDDIVITRPTSGISFATGDAYLIEWISNPAATDTDNFRLNLYNELSTTVAMEIASSLDVSAGQYLFTFPGYLSSGNYWFGATKNATIRGYGPYPNNGQLGSNTVAVTAGASCSAHSQCSSTQYCDRLSLCMTCNDCNRWYDAIDWVCPSKCGGSPTFTVGSRIPDVAEADASGELDDYILPGCPAFDRLVINANPLVSFASSSASGDDPQRMTQRLSQKLDTLASAVAIDSRFDGLQIHVRAAYRAPPVSMADASLHNAGRAAELSVVNTTSPSGAVASIYLVHLGRLAAFAGLDWVYYAAASHIYVSVIPDGCSTPLDLALLLDGSGSISLPQYGGTPGNFVHRMLGFAKALVPYFDFGPNTSHTRMSVTTFSSTARIDFHLNDHLSATSLRQAIDGITYPEGGTRTSLGLNTIRTSVFTEANGMRSGTAGIPRVTIVLTDGKSSQGYGPATETALLKDNPVNSQMISIGIGTGYSLSELNTMASSPVSQNVYTLKTFARVPAIVDKISFSACQSRSILDSGTETSGTVSQCEFVFFRSQCGHLQESVVEVVSDSGLVHVYVDNTTSPGPFRYLYKDESTDVLKSLIITRAAGETSPLFIGIKGVGNGTNSFTVRIWSNVFVGSSSVSVSIAEDATSGTLVWQPASATSGITYSILSGNTGSSIPPFAIDSSTGVVSVNSALDYEAISNYTLRVSAENNGLECQNGILFIAISITDVNDVTPTFVGAPYSASVAIGAPAGFPILTVSADDTDGNTLAYSLTIARRSRVRRQISDFVIDSSTGTISTGALIDGSTTSYSLTVSAFDGTFTGTASVNVVVNPCDTCPSGQYVSSSCSGGTTAVSCATVSTCGAGELMVSDATLVADRECGPCPPGTYQNATTHTSTSCIPHRKCGPGEVVVVLGTSTTDVQCAVATSVPTTLAPTTAAPTFAPTGIPTTLAPTTRAPTTITPTTIAPTVFSPNGGGSVVTFAPTTAAPTTAAPTTAAPTTAMPTTIAPTTGSPSVTAPTAFIHTPTTVAPSTVAPTTVAPSTVAPSTTAPTTLAPSTSVPTTAISMPTTDAPITLAPSTIAPSTVAPTTVAPTTIAPTTVAPTTGGFLGTAAPTASSSADSSESSAAGSDVMWWPALIVLLLLLMVLAAVVHRERRLKDSTDKRGMNPLFGKFHPGVDTAATDALLATSSGALLGSRNPLWEAFRRCIAFDGMYYGNPFLQLDNDTLREVYGVLQLKSPNEDTLGKLRLICSRFFAATMIADVPDEPLYEDVNDFFWSAIADEMVERAIDAIARTHEYDESSGGVHPTYEAASVHEILEQCLSELTEDYVPAANDFLVPVSRNKSLRQLPVSSASVDDAVYDIGAAAEADKHNEELNYALASGSNSAEYMIADHTDMANEYAISKPQDTDEIYSLANSSGEKSPAYDADMDEIYTLATGASVRSRRVQGDSDTVYDMGGTQAANNDAVYDIGGIGSALLQSESTDDVVYDIGGYPSATTTPSNDADVIYDYGTQNSDSSGVNVRDDDDAVYDNQTRIGIPANVPSEVPYDVGGGSVSDAVYDIGDVTEDTSDIGGIEATYSSQRSNRGHAAIVPELYSASTNYDLGRDSSDTKNSLMYDIAADSVDEPATYDVAAAAATETENCPDYNTADARPEDFVEPDDEVVRYALATEDSNGSTLRASRSRSYDNALDQVSGDGYLGLGE